MLYIQSVVAGGDTYVFDPNTTYDTAKEYVIGPKIATFVAVLESDAGSHEIVGFYKLIANQRDLGSHVSNASFMVSPRARGKGVGRQLVGSSFYFTALNISIEFVFASIAGRALFTRGKKKGILLNAGLQLY